MEDYTWNQLDELESEAIYTIREVFGQFKNSAILFSGGKDSIVLVHLAMKAFYPGKIPFSLLHIDTGHNFQETLDFRDQLVQKHNLKLEIRYVEDSIQQGKCRESGGPLISRNSIQSVTLLDAIEELLLDACIGGARRDEEKARAKERFFSHRDDFGQWTPRNQRPELWNLYNGKKNQGENFRIFPLSNWTEIDVWNYIKQEKINVPSLYFAHTRDVFEYNGVLYAKNNFVDKNYPFRYKKKIVRFRTIGDMSCTGAIESNVHDTDGMIRELTILKTSERSTRADDQSSDSAMEDRKENGYF
jgi:sulfate adenylyltransferase subunit 2